MISKDIKFHLIFGGLLCLSILPITYLGTFSLTIGISILQIDLIPLALLIAHIKLNPEFEAKIKSWRAPSPEHIEQQESNKENHFELQVSSFKKKYESKSINELQKIVDEGSFLPEAIEAAKRLIKEK